MLEQTKRAQLSMKLGRELFWFLGQSINNVILSRVFCGEGPM
jgi:hypothetical protein